MLTCFDRSIQHRAFLSCEREAERKRVWKTWSLCESLRCVVFACLWNVDDEYDGLIVWHHHLTLPPLYTQINRSVGLLPAALYALQNTMAQIGYQNLDSLTFNLLNQTKARQRAYGRGWMWRYSV